MKKQCKNCCWYNSIDQICCFKAYFKIKKRPDIDACINYKSDRNIAFFNEKGVL